MRVPSLGQEDPLEEGMATHSSVVALKISVEVLLFLLGAQVYHNDPTDVSHLLCYLEYFS